jgi:hypothetical protein
MLMPERRKKSLYKIADESVSRECDRTNIFGKDSKTLNHIHKYSTLNSQNLLFSDYVIFPPSLYTRIVLEHWAKGNI